MSAPQTSKKSTNTAAIASVVFPGLGQFYNGQSRKGIVFVIVGAALLYSVATSRAFAFGLSIAVYAAVWMYNLYDAYSTAKAINEGAT